MLNINTLTSLFLSVWTLGLVFPVLDLVMSAFVAAGVAAIPGAEDPGPGAARVTSCCAGSPAVLVPSLAHSIARGGGISSTRLVPR
jgi:hypothetical protein